MTGSQLAGGIVVFVVTVALFGAALVLAGWLLSYRRHEPEKETPYECGELPVVETRSVKTSVNYYTFALAFLIFDVEVIFLLPWVKGFMKYGWAAVIEAAVFLAVLLFGLWYGFRSGGLRWE